MKIGFSADPWGRVDSITTRGLRPRDVKRGAAVDFIGYIPGGRREEAAFHRQFATSWVEGEWFTIDDEAVRQIIWDDPCGIDVQRMSALAVFAAHRHAGITRDEIAHLLGGDIMARSFEDVLSHWRAS